MGPIRWMLGIFICIGIVFILMGSYSFVRDWKTMRWAEAEGVVMKSSVLHLGVRIYVASVEYEYFVNDRKMLGKVVESGPDIPTYSSATIPRRVINRYPAGKKVIVYFDPLDPSQAVLEPGLSKGSWLIFVLGIGFVGIGGVGLREVGTG